MIDAAEIFSDFSLAERMGKVQYSSNNKKQEVASMPSSSSAAAAATIVVVAKTPVAGQSKTRLIPALGPGGSAVLAQALLLDVLTTVTAAMSVS